jgi:hypothetical protein
VQFSPAAQASILFAQGLSTGLAFRSTLASLAPLALRHNPKSALPLLRPPRELTEACFDLHIAMHSICAARMINGCHINMAGQHPVEEQQFASISPIVHNALLTVGLAHDIMYWAAGSSIRMCQPHYGFKSDRLKSPSPPLSKSQCKPVSAFWRTHRYTWPVPSVPQDVYVGFGLLPRGHLTSSNTASVGESGAVVHEKRLHAQNAARKFQDHPAGSMTAWSTRCGEQGDLKVAEADTSDDVATTRTNKSLPEHPEFRKSSSGVTRLSERMPSMQDRCADTFPSCVSNCAIDPLAPGSMQETHRPPETAEIRAPAPAAALHVKTHDATSCLVQDRTCVSTAYSQRIPACSRSPQQSRGRVYRRLEYAPPFALSPFCAAMHNPHTFINALLPWARTPDIRIGCVLLPPVMLRDRLRTSGRGWTPAAISNWGISSKVAWSSQTSPLKGDCGAMLGPTPIFQEPSSLHSGQEGASQSSPLDNFQDRDRTEWGVSRSRQVQQIVYSPPFLPQVAPSLPVVLTILRLAQTPHEVACALEAFVQRLPQNGHRSSESLQMSKAPRQPQFTHSTDNLHKVYGRKAASTSHIPQPASDLWQSKRNGICASHGSGRMFGLEARSATVACASEAAITHTPSIPVNVSPLCYSESTTTVLSRQSRTSQDTSSPERNSTIGKRKGREKVYGPEPFCAACHQASSVRLQHLACSNMPWQLRRLAVSRLSNAGAFHDAVVVATSPASCSTKHREAEDVLGKDVAASLSTNPAEKATANNSTSEQLLSEVFTLLQGSMHKGVRLKTHFSPSEVLSSIDDQSKCAAQCSSLTPGALPEQGVQSYQRVPPCPRMLDVLLQELAASGAMCSQNKPLFRGQTKYMQPSIKRTEALQSAMLLTLRAAQVRISSCDLDLPSTQQCVSTSHMHTEGVCNSSFF